MQGGLNAFLLCARGGHLVVAEYLTTKMEEHLFDSDDDGYTALHWAALGGHLPMVQYLVRSCGFDLKAIDKVGLHCLLLVECILSTSLVTPAAWAQWTWTFVLELCKCLHFVYC